MSDFANQYGINLGAIDQAVSAQKTAKQNQELNALQINKLKDDKVKEDASEQADKDYIKDPKTAVATSIKQKLNWDTLDEADRKNAAEQLKAITNKHGIALNNIMNIQDPTRQKEALVQEFQQLTPDAQKAYTTKYGTTPEEWQANLHQAMNDILVTDGGVDMLRKEAEAKTANQYKLNEDAQKQKNALALKQLEVDAADKRLQQTQVFTSGQNDLNRQNRTKNAYIEHSGSNRQTEGDKNVQALMDANPGMTPNQARLAIMNAQRTTNVNDPIYGNKTIVSGKTLPDGGNNTTQPSGGNKQVQPSTYHPADVVRYGTKDGRKVAQMKDGSVIYVK